MLKKALTNPSILFLLAGNIYCIWYYENHPADFSTVVWIYWCQSITIGLFNFLDLFTVKNYRHALTPATNRASAWFFLFHFGFFHLAYAVFLFTDFGIRSVDSSVLLIGISAFFLECLINFMRHKRMERTMRVSIGAMFFLPYLRIIPMHLMILLPAFLGWKPSLIFLILKMGMDVVSSMLYYLAYSKNKILDTAGTSV